MKMGDIEEVSDRFRFAMVMNTLADDGLLRISGKDEYGWPGVVMDKESYEKAKALVGQV